MRFIISLIGVLASLVLLGASAFMNYLFMASLGQAEMESRVPTLSVGDAVMQMELSGTPLLVFRNEKHGGVNVVHRRDDGNVGWIDPRGNG